MDTFSQTVEETIPQTLWVANDTFLLKYATYPVPDTFTVSRKDKSSPGTDAQPDIYATIYYNRDSLVLRYNNRLPYQHNLYVN